MPALKASIFERVSLSGILSYLFDCIINQYIRNTPNFLALIMVIDKSNPGQNIPVLLNRNTQTLLRYQLHSPTPDF